MFIVLQQRYSYYQIMLNAAQLLFRVTRVINNVSF